MLCQSWGWSPMRTKMVMPIALMEGHHHTEVNPRHEVEMTVCGFGSRHTVPVTWFRRMPSRLREKCSPQVCAAQGAAAFVSTPFQLQHQQHQPRSYRFITMVCTRPIRRASLCATSAMKARARGMHAYLRQGACGSLAPRGRVTGMHVGANARQASGQGFVQRRCVGVIIPARTKPR